MRLSASAKLALGVAAAFWILRGAMGLVAQSSPQPAVQLSPSETASYAKALPLAVWSSEAAGKDPLLEGLHCVASQDSLPHILKLTGEACDAEFRDFSRIACDEEITSWSGKTKLAIDNFRYIVIPHLDGDTQKFEEYRIGASDQNPYLAIPSPSLKLLTTGHVAMFLHFDSTDQKFNHYQYLGTQSLRDKNCHVVAFAQDPSRFCRHVEFITGDNPRSTLLLRGFAWIDAQSFEILRVETSLLAPIPDVGLKKHQTVVDFYPVKPADFDKVLLLPRDVTVELDSLGSKKRNVHHYSNFKVFRVESTIKP
jgi:hypothetical protein